MDLIDRIRSDIDSRLEELRPQVAEIPRLESVLAALDAAAQSQGGGARTSPRRGRPRSRGATAATKSRTSRPRRRARRGQRREEFLQLVTGHPEITIAEAARQIGVSPPQISTLVRRLEEEGAIERADGRFVLIAPAASHATSDEIAVVEGDSGSAEGEIQGPGVEELAPEVVSTEEELAPEAARDEAGRPQAT